MQQQVERVQVAAHFVGQRVDQHALPFQLRQQRGLAVGVGPSLQEAVERIEATGEVDAGVVAQALGDELALGVEVLHALAGHGHGDQAADDVFLGLIGTVGAGQGVERAQRVGRLAVAKFRRDGLGGVVRFRRCDGDSQKSSSR